MAEAEQPKQLFWVGASRKAIRGLPADVQDVFGFALYRAQQGAMHPDAKPLRGFGGAGVLEVVGDHAGDTYRAVYTVKFARAVYVLHVFKKKSKAGSKTPQADVELIRKRLKDAETHYERWVNEQ